MIEQETGHSLELLDQVMDQVEVLMSYQRRAFCAQGPHRELSLPQLFLLITLHERGTLSVSTLADLLGVTAPSASALIDRMEERGWVARDRDMADRRVVHVSITEAGHSLLDDMVGMKRDRMRQVLSQMDADELGHVAGAVAGLRRVLGATSLPDHCPPH
jgi:DNA-binding MarR family transcriptional regulator